MSTVEILSHDSELQDVLIRAGRLREDGSFIDLGARLLRPGEAIVVGSAAGADLVLAEDTVSQRHLRLEHERTHVLASDLGSKNGTELLGLRVERADLQPGARVQLGRCVLDVLRPSEIVSESTGRPLRGLVGSSPPMLHLADRVRRFARLGEPVLVRGESGTGKELVARAVHDESDRRAGPFVALNAASLSRELAESELFGHRRGAFTGAMADRKGAFREATGGTLFIDEVAQLGLEVQAKLLRAVEEGKVRPLGADGAVPVDVRLVAATCEPIEQYVLDRRFRADLYQRIAVCVVRVPPLRERLSDLPALARYLGKSLGIDSSLLSSSALRALAACEHRGNVRELRSTLLHAALAAGVGNVIDETHVATAVRERSGQPARPSAWEAARTVEACRGNVSEAARRLGLPRSTLRDLLAAQKRPPTTSPFTVGETTGVKNQETPDEGGAFSSWGFPPYQSTMTYAMVPPAESAPTTQPTAATATFAEWMPRVSRS